MKQIKTYPIWYWLMYETTKYLRRVQSCAWRLIKYWPPTPLSTQRMCPPPAPKAGVHIRRAVRGVGGSIFWKTPAIGLASYSLISLRLRYQQSRPINCTRNSGQFNLAGRSISKPEIYKMFPLFLCGYAGLSGSGRGFWIRIHGSHWIHIRALPKIHWCTRPTVGN